MADTYRPYVAELADKRGYIHPIHAKQLAEERTVTMTGDVTGTANWDFGEPASSSQASESMALSIGEKKVTTVKLDDGAVTTPKVADDAVTLAKIDDNAMNGTVQDNDSKLATHAAVKTYVDAQISGQGTYLGKKTVAEVNAMNVNNLHNGDRVQMADAGTINLGPGGVGFDVVAGEDLILYKSGSTVQWDTMDGDFKTKQTPVSDPAADGTTITAIDTVSQNANGEITATKKTIRTGNGSNTGVVKLSDSTSSTSGVSGGVAATPAAVKAAYDLASNKKDKQTAIDTDTSSGSGKGGTTRTLTRLQQDANGVITPTFADIPTASTQTKGLMGTAEYTKLSGIAEGATKTEASSTNGNIKIDGTETTVYSHPTQTAYTGKPTADAAPAFGGTFTVSQVTTNGTGHVTGLTDRTITIPSATATTSSNGLMSSSDKSKLDGIAEGAEVNQNAFGNVKVGNDTIAADSKTDTLEIAGGTGIDAVGDTANDKVTLSLNSATQASLGKADSAVQDVTVDGASVVNSSTKVAAVPNASTSAKGAVQLAGSIGATVASENNKAATEKAVRDAINALDAEVTSSDGTNVQVKVTETDGKISAVNVTTDNTENRNNKVSAWQSTPDNTHYPSEKLVKDGLDAKADAYKVVAISDSITKRVDAGGGSWFKIASKRVTATWTDSLRGEWDVTSTTTQGQKVGKLQFVGRWTSGEIGVYIKSATSQEALPPLKIVTIGTVGDITVEIWVSLSQYASLSIRERSSGTYALDSTKQWTYYNNNGSGSSEPTDDAGAHKKVYDVDAIRLQRDIESPTDNNLVAMDASGLVKDSGLTKSSVESAITSAGSAIQGVKVNNTTLTPDANKVVTVPLATTSADGAMSAADKAKLNGIEAGAEVNVQSDWNVTNDSSDAFIKNKPQYKYYSTTSTYAKICSFPLDASGENFSGYGIDILYRRYLGEVHGRLLYKKNFKFYCEYTGDISYTNQSYSFYYVVNSNKMDVYAKRNGYTTLNVAPLANIPKDQVDFTNFGTEVSSLPEGATEITPVWVASSASSSGTAPVKVGPYGQLTAVGMDSTPTASSTNLMTSGDIKTALDAKQDSLPTSGMASDTYTININGTAESFKKATGSSSSTSRYAKLYTIDTTSGDSLSAGIIISYVSRDSNNNNRSGFIRFRATSSDASGYVTILNSGYVGNTTTTRFGFCKNANGKYEVWALLYSYARVTAQIIARDSISYTIHNDVYETEQPSGFEFFSIGLNVTKANNQAAVGSTSIPTYVDSDGEIKACTDDFVHDADVTSTYSATGTAPVNGIAVAAALNAEAVRSVQVETVSSAKKLTYTKNSGTGGAAVKTDILEFMTTAEATSLWQSAWAAAN